MKHNYFSLRSKLFSFALLFTLLTLPRVALSQLIVNGGGTPTSIINAFVGAGLTVSNVQLNCGPDTVTGAYGTFNGTSSNVGLANGIILSSGSATNAIGPNNSTFLGTNWGTTSADPQLTAIEPLATNDLCILEFDIVPHCSSVQIRFVFGSEEYPEFVNGGYNDAFGFFVTGPDSNCVPGFFNNTNVAVLPNGTPASIDNINDGYSALCTSPLPGPCMNCAYYVDNCTGTTVQYDGFTTAIIVNLAVCPCATYHWKFAIADAGDGAYDSGVLIDYLNCAAPFTYNVSTTQASCSCDGTATVNVTSGTPPYTYQWSNNATTQTVTNLCPGTYTVTVTDAASCNFGITQTFTITSSSTTLNTTATQTNVSCNGGSDGSATANVSGGTAPYSYLWSTVPPQASQTAINLSAGTYTVSVTDSLGCVGTVSVTITEPPVLAIAFTNFTHTSCGYSNGSISPVYSGGTGQYSYSWNTVPAQTSSSVSNLAAGTYVVTVTDANNCTVSSSFTINASSPPTVVTTGDQSICLNQSVQLGVAGASTYVWSPATGLSATTGSTVTANPVVTTTYMIIGTDAANCSDTAYITVTVNPLPLVVSPANPSYCLGGSAVVNISGAAYFSWSPQTGIISATGPDSSTVTIATTSTTTYTVVGYSAEGCSASTVFTVTVNPDPIAIITPNGPTAFCPGGSVNLTASGGISFLWSDNSTAATLFVNTGGTYTVTVMDANTCTGSTSATVTVHALPVAAITPVGPVTICTNVPAVLSATTGQGYSYQWYMNSAVIPNATSDQYTTMTTGTYSVLITDANGCTAVSNNVQVTQGVGPAVTIVSPPPVGCLQNAIYIGYGPQSVQICAQSDASAVAWLWSTGATTQCINVNQPGNYTVIAYDASGCPSPTPAVLDPPIQVIDIRCGHGLKKIMLCHVPEGQPGNPQTLCIGPPAIPPHLELHRYDCLGPCSLYFRESDIIDVDNFFVYSHPNPFNNGFHLSILTASSSSVTVNVHDMLGRIVETYNDVTEQTLIGTELTNGIYFAEVIQDDNRQMIQIIKSE
jgi:hypothetical protein